MLIYDFNSKEVRGIETRKLAKGPFKWHAAVSLAGQFDWKLDQTGDPDVCLRNSDVRNADVQDLERTDEIWRDSNS